jgi:hypothetical protein
LKAAEFSAILLLYQTQVQAISTRILLQSSLLAWNNGSRSQEEVASVISVRTGATAVTLKI